jgi:hypothetical protein
MMTLTEDEHALERNDLLHVRFGSTGPHTVSTTPNIQVRGLHITRKGATTHYSDGTRQRLAGGLVPSSDSYRP